MNSAEHEIVEGLLEQIEHLKAQVKELTRSNEAYCSESLQFKGEMYKAQRKVERLKVACAKEFESVQTLDNENTRLKHEILWVIEDVWPLVHRLTSRETLKKRFLQLNDFMGKLPNGKC